MFRNSEMITRNIRFVCPDCKQEMNRTVTLPADFQIFHDGDQLICVPCGNAKRDLEERKHIANAEAQRIEATGVKAEFRNYDMARANIQMFDWIQKHTGTNMLVISEVNSGKTRAMCEVLLEESRCGARCRYMEFGTLAAVYSGEKKESTSSAQRLIKRILDYDILILDDIDKVKLTETTGELLYKILNEVYSGGTKARIWLTCNHSGQELMSKFEVKDQAAAVLSRIERMNNDGRFAVKKF